MINIKDTDARRSPRSLTRRLRKGMVLSALALFLGLAEGARAQTITEFPIPTAGSGPTDITAGPDGNLWFTESPSGNRIGRITPAGVITEFAVPASPPAAIPSASRRARTATSGSPSSAAPDQIGRITPAGVITEFPRHHPGSDPTGITAGPDGNLWFTEHRRQPDRPDHAGRRHHRVHRRHHARQRPDGITAGPGRQPLVHRDHDGNRIGRITPRGRHHRVLHGTTAGQRACWHHGRPGRQPLVHRDASATRSAASPRPASSPSSPVGTPPAATRRTSPPGPDGNLWFTEMTGNRIGRITPAGVVTEFPLPASPPAAARKASPPARTATSGSPNSTATRSAGSPRVGE